MKVSPSILSADFAILKEEIETIKSSDMVHIDVMDGMFVPNITIGPCVIKSIRAYTDMFFDVHLMIENPIRYIDDFVKAGSDLITIHYETENVKECLEYIRNKNVKVGLSIKPKTAVKEIIPYLGMVDLVLVMSVEPGFGGQSFMYDAVNKIKELSDLKNKYHYEIEVDGGINAQTAALCKEAGADILVAGSYIFKLDDRKKGIDSLRWE